MEFIMHLGIVIGIYALLGLSLNLLVGYTGSVSLAQAAFFGIGAYGMAILATRFQLHSGMAVLISVCISSGLSVLAGSILSSLHGDTYTLGSLAFGTIVTTIFLNWTSVTNGPLGIARIPRPHVFGLNFSDNQVFLVLVLGLVCAVACLCRYVTRSSAGLVLSAIREDETTIRLFGYNTVRYRQFVWVFSAAIAALAGTLFAQYITFIEPSMFFQGESIFLLTLIILGGLASHTGSIVGAVVLIVLPEMLRFLGLSSEYAAQVRQLIYGAGLILLLYLRPRGICGTYVLRS